MKTKKIRNLVEEHLSQKDTFADDDELEEDSLVKCKIRSLLILRHEIFIKSYSFFCIL